MVYVVADEVGWCVHDLAVHVDSFGAVGVGDCSCGVDGGFSDFCVPSELGDAGVVLGVDFCESGLGEWDFAVAA